MQHARTEQAGMIHFASVLQQCILVSSISSISSCSSPLFFLFNIFHHLTLCMVLSPVPVPTPPPTCPSPDLFMSLDPHASPRSFPHCVRLAHVNHLLLDSFEFLSYPSIFQFHFFCFLCFVSPLYSWRSSSTATISKAICEKTWQLCELDL